MKGHDVLLRAFPLVRKKCPEARLVIIGQGGEMDTLSELCQTLNIDDYVWLAGGKGREDIKEALDESAVFAFPSRSEGFGIALVEAMSMGLPPVASNVGGIPELVGKDAGILVEPDNPEQLAEAIVTLLVNESLRTEMGQRAKHAVRNYSSENVIDQYEHLFRTLCA